MTDDSGQSGASMGVDCSKETAVQPPTPGGSPRRPGAKGGVAYIVEPVPPTATIKLVDPTASPSASATGSTESSLPGRDSSRRSSTQLKSALKGSSQNLEAVVENLIAAGGEDYDDLVNLVNGGRRGSEPSLPRNISWDRSVNVGIMRGGLVSGTDTYLLPSKPPDKALPDGSKYWGPLCDGRMEGPGGTRLFANGTRYFGDFENNKMHGRGRFIWASGTTYVGDWVCDEMHGQGAKIWPHGARYRGEFRNDQMCGHGTYNWASGNKYVGTWKANSMHGVGCKTYRDGTKQQGYWECDKFLG